VSQKIAMERFDAAGLGNHHGWLGFAVTSAEHGRVVANMAVRADHLNPGGTVHGGVTASFADTLAAYGVFASLPPDADGFTTINLAAQYLGRARLRDTLTGTAVLVNGGRRIQTWDVTIASDDATVGLVRVTELLRYPKLVSDGTAQRGPQGRHS
jgi:1,4-dihydroxy-2-naphthoyl-CoA hydrolase